MTANDQAHTPRGSRMGGRWLVIDGYEDEPAAFGVPNYVGFHIRYICAVLESRNLEYTYTTIDEWRIKRRKMKEAQPDSKSGDKAVEGVVILAGAIVPGKYVRGTPISQRETNQIIREMPNDCPLLIGGWAVRSWRQAGWMPLKRNLFMAVQDTDATLDHFLRTGTWKHKRRTPDQWKKWALKGASSKAVSDHPDLFTDAGQPGPLTYEVELYQGCVRYKRGCKFCIEPKKGVPVWRDERDVIEEIRLAADSGVRNVRIGGATDVYTYKAEGVVELEYPVPNPQPIADVLHGIREDERIEILHVDNANPSIISENLEEASAITETMVETLSDGAVLSFGLESADSRVHEENWLNCDAKQLIQAVKHVNDAGRERGERGMPKLLPGLNFIAGLNGETKETYRLNMQLLNQIKNLGLMLRRINIRQVEGAGFQEVPREEFRRFKSEVRSEIDTPMLQKVLPTGTILKDVWWESFGDRIRKPEHVMNLKYRNESCHGSPGVTFGRQIGAYPILVGVQYQIPLETKSNVMITGHGSRSVTAVEVGLDPAKVTENQLASIPGIGRKNAWALISARAKATSKGKPIHTHQEMFEAADIVPPAMALDVFENHSTGSQ